MDSGNTVFYIVAAIIMGHFLVGFIFLVRKLSGPVPEETAGEGSIEQMPADTGQD